MCLHFRELPASAIYLEAQSDRRPFFIIPWNGNYLIGTTDVRFEDDPDQVRSESWEIDYLLAETNRAFPDAGLTREQILFTLIQASGHCPGPGMKTSKASRAGISFVSIRE